MQVWVLCLVSRYLNSTGKMVCCKRNYIMYLAFVGVARGICTLLKEKLSLATLMIGRASVIRSMWLCSSNSIMSVVHSSGCLPLYQHLQCRPRAIFHFQAQQGQR